MTIIKKCARYIGNFIFCISLFLLLWFNFTNAPQFYNHYDKLKYLYMTGILALIIPIFILFQSYQLQRKEQRIRELELQLHLENTVRQMTPTQFQERTLFNDKYNKFK